MRSIAPPGPAPTFKTPDMKALQRRLDWRVYALLGCPPPEPDDRAAIALLDTRALLVEAYVRSPKWCARSWWTRFVLARSRSGNLSGKL